MKVLINGRPMVERMEELTSKEGQMMEVTNIIVTSGGILFMGYVVASKLFPALIERVADSEVAYKTFETLF